MSTIETIWQRAHEWFETNAPDALEWLAPPASLEMIARAEETLGVTLPDDLRESLQIHNGQLPYTAPLFAGLRLLPLEEIVRDWQVDSRIAAAEGRTPARSLPPDVVKPVWVSAGSAPSATRSSKTRRISNQLTYG